VEKFDKVTSGQRLRRERLNRSLSQEEVAEKIGSTATNVSRWELGQTSPTPFFRRKLCELFEKSPQELFPLSSQESSISSSEHLPSQGSSSKRERNANNVMEGQHRAGAEQWREAEEHRETNSVFRFNTPLTDAHEFFGRRGEWIPLLGRLRLGSSVSIIGKRRIGKTWLLSYLRLVAPTQLGPRYHIAYVDATLPSCNTLDDLTATMLGASGILAIERATANEHLTMLEKAVRELAEKQETLVLCIDEFESLCDKAGFEMTVLERLRAMTNLGLCLLTASRYPLLRVITEKVGKSGETSPFFNVFEQITLKPFTRKEAEAFAQAKSLQAGFTEQEYAYLLQLGQEEEGNQQWPPLRLQLVGKMIEEDKIWSARDPLYPYLPADPHYWQEFQVRLEEKYQGVVG
jgi:transcriptional regulator with XRE-family HTH domain